MPSPRSCSARRAAATSTVNLFPHYQWTFAAPWIQDDWRVNNKLTLNLGFRWDFNGPVSRGAESAELRVRPDHRQSRCRRASGSRCSAASGSSASTARPTTPWKYDKNNCQLARRRAPTQINEKTVLRAGYGKYFLNPTGQSFTNGFSLATPIDRVERRRPHADLRAGESVPERDPGAARQLARPADVPRARVRASRTRTSSSRTSTSSRPASSASCHGTSRSTRATPAAAATT